MNKKLPSILVIVLFWILLVDRATASQSFLDPKKYTGFFTKNKVTSLFFGIKSWSRIIDKDMKHQLAIGIETSVGPFIEWKPVSGVGIQTGLFYSYISLFALGLYENSSSIFGRSSSSILDSSSIKKNIYGISLDNIILRSLSIPLFFRCYPDKTRKFVFYGGPCLMVMLFRPQRKPYYHLYADLSDQNVSHAMVKDNFPALLRTLLNKNPDSNLLSSRDYTRFWWVWEFGFEFNGNNGFIIGIHGLGLILGCDCKKLFFNDRQ